MKLTAEEEKLLAEAWEEHEREQLQEAEEDMWWRIGIAKGLLESTLLEAKHYIEETEECIDGEWGASRTFKELHEAGVVTKAYDKICEILELLTKKEKT